MRTDGRSTCLVAAGFAMLTVSGCGDSGPSYEKAKLAGLVTIDGTAVAEGSIRFTLVEAKEFLTEVPITDGKYTAEDVPVGWVKVTFAAGPGGEVRRIGQFLHREHQSEHLASFDDGPG